MEGIGLEYPEWRSEGLGRNGLSWRGDLEVERDGLGWMDQSWEQI